MSPRTRIKICGITRTEDALGAVAAGVDAIGLVFVEASPRHVTVEQARAAIAGLPPFVSVVGLFVDAAPEQVRAVLGAVALDLIQFHGQEDPEYCGSFGRPYIKAVRMAPGVDLRREAQRYAAAAGLLLDSYQPGAAGGTGETFDWARIPAGLGKPVILAGGLMPENVAQAVRTVRPYAVDVSSGVERAKGIKDAARIAAFVQAVATAG